MRKFLALTILLAALSGCIPAAPSATPTPLPPTATTAPALTATASRQPTLPPIITATPQGTPTSTPLPKNAIARYRTGTTPDLVQIWLDAGGNGWAVAQANKADPNDQHILHTPAESPGGVPWRDMTPPQATSSLPGWRAAAFFLDSQRAWAAYVDISTGATAPDGVTIWRTSNGGATWQKSAPIDLGRPGGPVATGPIRFMPDGKTGWAIVHMGAGMSHDYIDILATSDGGATWSRLVDAMDENMGHVMICYKNGLGFAEAKNGWLAGTCGGVKVGVLLFRTKDGGRSWDIADLPAPAQAPKLFNDVYQACDTQPPVFFNEKQGILQVDCRDYSKQSQTVSGWMYVTGDGGESWAPRPLPAGGGHFQFLSMTEGFFVGGGQVMRTGDGGKSWATVTKVNWEATLNFVDGQNGWAVATSVPAGGGETAYALVRTFTGGKTWILGTASIVP